MSRWRGRTALITGASSGIGLAVAKKLALSGMKVYGCARNIKKLQEFFAGLSGSLVAVRCDVSKESDILETFEKIKQETGGLDVCVNSAGIGYENPLLSGETDKWKYLLDVNVIGSCICTREAVKSMKEKNVDDGHIFLMNSMSGHRFAQNAAFTHFYSASKFAITALTEGFRRELREMNSGIRITAISPGLVETEFHYRMFSDQGKATAGYSAIQCLKPEDIADSVLYALEAPPHVQVHDILIRPTDQVS